MVRRLAIVAAVAATVLAGVLRATAQDATPPPTRGDLVATVAALDTREAMQDRRIAALETRVALLMLVPTEPTDWPPTPAAAAPTPMPVAARPGTHLLTGTIELVGEWPGSVAVLGRQAGDQCFGDGGYGDMFEGGAVTVRDATGQIIATGRLGMGTLAGPAVYQQDATCRLPFTVADVPDADFYSVEVTHRGELSYSRADMESQGWVLSLHLGN